MALEFAMFAASMTRSGLLRAVSRQAKPVTPLLGLRRPSTSHSRRAFLR
jgi:hypothetical protein